MNREPTNEDRAYWAQEVLSAFRRLVMPAEPMDTVAQDFLADLMHWCDRENINFDHLLRAARQAYVEEK